MRKRGTYDSKNKDKCSTFFHPCNEIIRGNFQLLENCPFETDPKKWLFLDFCEASWTNTWIYSEFSNFVDFLFTLTFIERLLQFFFFSQVGFLKSELFLVMSKFQIVMVGTGGVGKRLILVKR
jgi:hypothetical protein